MKKKSAKRKALGGLMGAAIKDGGIANLSPAVALAKSLKSGKPEGILRLSPLAQLMRRGEKEDDSADKELKSDSKDRSTRPTLATRGMKRGGKVRGDGICQRGNTKGTMR